MSVIGTHLLLNSIFKRGLVVGLFIPRVLCTRRCWCKIASNHLDTFKMLSRVLYMNAGLTAIKCVKNRYYHQIEGRR